jgi:hypothetical protein
MKLDWEKAEQYDDIDTLGYHALAFEFLRRNQKYQAVLICIQ